LTCLNDQLQQLNYGRFAIPEQSFILSETVQYFENCPIQNFNFIFQPKLFCEIRLPNLHPSWLVENTSVGARATLKNLVTLKIEDCIVDEQFVQYVRYRTPLKNLSVRRSRMGMALLHFFVPQMPPRPINAAHHCLKVLDISGMRDYTPTLVNEWVLKDDLCQVTHLYMEGCTDDIPRRVSSNHLRIEFISFAGYRPYNTYGLGRKIFEDIDSWAGISSVKRINASGCDMTQVHRDDLMRRHPNVVFNMSDQFEESPRFEF
jgi:hypothetical protein